MNENQKSQTNKNRSKQSKSESSQQKKQNDNGSGFSFNADFLQDQIDVVKGLAGKTSEVVQKAASILEEEISAGIVAAKKAEEKFLSVSELRSEDSNEVIQRFRKDAHEVIDIVLDLVNAAAKSMGKITDQIISIGGQPGEKQSKSSASAAVPTFTLPKVLKPGESIEVPMMLQNTSDKSTKQFELFSTDLVNGEGDRILARNITFTPSSLEIKPQKTEKVTVKLKLPKTTKPGTYTGLIRAKKLDQLQAVVTVNVE